MSIFDGLTLIGGLCLFLFGMNIMGQALERRAGSKLQTLLGKLTTNKIAGLFTGLGVTAVIQSSSATTVMVVGFVNSGLMTLRQAIHVIMGANIGTTVTAWILSLGGIESSNVFVQLLKPASFTPILTAIIQSSSASVGIYRLWQLQVRYLMVPQSPLLWDRISVLVLLQFFLLLVQTGMQRELLWCIFPLMS